MTRKRRSSKKHSRPRPGRRTRRGPASPRRGGRSSAAARRAREPSASPGAGPRDHEPLPVAGLKVELVVTAFEGSNRDAKRVERAALIRPPRGGAKAGFPRAQDREAAAQRVARGVEPPRLAGLLAAMAHHQRAGILLKLLGGEATHRLLSKATGLKSGPLYHHLRELRSAGLIGPKIRDLYVITPRGRRAILAALALERICR